MPDERISDKLKIYAHIETEQAHHAREAADAIFKPKKPAAVDEVEADRTDATASLPQQPGRMPRILPVRQLDHPETAPEPKVPAKPEQRGAPENVPEIPISEYRRIRTLAAYGMTIKEVAEMYGVGARRIERIVSKARGAT